MEKLLKNINVVIKYGLNSNLIELDKEINLERSLVNIYQSYFEYNYEFDQNEYEDFDKSKFPNIVENIKSNFPDFGFYNIHLSITETPNSSNNQALGDAIDDLSDIMYDLLEVKWRLENNSIDDGIWFFKFIFESHTKQHIIDLLNYLNQKEY